MQPPHNNNINKIPLSLDRGQFLGVSKVDQCKSRLLIALQDDSGLLIPLKSESKGILLQLRDAIAQKSSEDLINIMEGLQLEHLKFKNNNAKKEYKPMLDQLQDTICLYYVCIAHQEDASYGNIFFPGDKILDEFSTLYDDIYKDDPITKDHAKENIAWMLFGLNKLFLTKLGFADKVSLLKNENNPLESYNIVKKLFAQYYTELQEIDLPKTPLQSSINKVSHTIEVTRSDRYYNTKKDYRAEKDFIDFYQTTLKNLRAYLIEPFDEKIEELIIQEKVNSFEEVVYNFIGFCNERHVSPDLFAEHLEETFIFNRLKKIANSHQIKTLEAIKTSEKNTSQKNSYNKETSTGINTNRSVQKAIPGEIIEFAAFVADQCASQISDTIKQYILRLYRNKKPLKPTYLYNKRGISKETVERICHIGEELGFDVIYDVDESQDDTEALSPASENTSASTKEEIEIVEDNKQIKIPQSGAELIGLLKDHGFKIFNEKKMIKLFQDILISKDSNAIMRKRLLFCLKHPDTQSQLKKDKVYTFEVGYDYRIIIKIVDGEHYITDIVAHGPQYNAYMSERFSK